MIKIVFTCSVFIDVVVIHHILENGHIIYVSAVKQTALTLDLLWLCIVRDEEAAFLQRQLFNSYELMSLN